jgi:pantothenate synthetase
VELQYLEVVDPETLQAVERARAGTVVAVAALVGSTRLIDNVVLGGEGESAAGAIPGVGGTP